MDGVHQRVPEDLGLRAQSQLRSLAWAKQGQKIMGRDRLLQLLQGTACSVLLMSRDFARERKISLKFSCRKFFQIRDVATQIPGHPGHSLSKTTEKCHLDQVLVRDIPTSGPPMSQEYPSQKPLCLGCFSVPDLPGF